MTWISHGVTCIPHPDPPSHLPLHPTPRGLPSAPGPSTCLKFNIICYIPLQKKFIAYMYIWVYFKTLFFSTDLWIYTFVYIVLPFCGSFIVVLKSGIVIPPTLFVFKIVLTIFISLPVHQNFRINLLTSTTNLLAFWLTLCSIYRSVFRTIGMLLILPSDPWTWIISSFTSLISVMIFCHF